MHGGKMRQIDLFRKNNRLDALVDDMIDKLEPVTVCLKSYYDCFDEKRQDIDVYVEEAWHSYVPFSLAYEEFHYQIKLDNVKDLGLIQQNKLMRRLEADNYTPNLTHKDTYGGK